MAHRRPLEANSRFGNKHAWGAVELEPRKTRVAAESFLDMASILCLIAAGANPSISTLGLTQDLLEWRGLRDPTGSPEIVGAIEQGNADPRTPFYAWLAERLPLAKRRAKTLNFEDLIYIVEMIASNVGTITTETPWHTNTTASLTGDIFIPTSLTENVARQNTAYMAEQSCIFILERIVERSRQAPSPTKAASLLARLRNECRASLQVFSLNYDTSATDGITTGWWTSFFPRPDGVEEFAPKAALPEGRDVNIQLHGSVHFGLEFNATKKVAKVRRYPAVAQAQRAWGITTGHDIAQDDHILSALPMITGRRKADMILAEPFASYFHYFRQAAMSTPRWLMVGYGGKDPHVNAVLATAAEKWGDQLRVAVCNYLPDKEIIRLRLGTRGMSCRYFLGSPRQDTALLIWDILSPFEADYYQFFRDHSLTNDRCLRADRGEKFGRVMLTVDGQSLAHFRKIRNWLSI